MKAKHVIKLIARLNPKPLASVVVSLKSPEELDKLQVWARTQCNVSVSSVSDLTTALITKVTSQGIPASSRPLPPQESTLLDALSESANKGLIVSLPYDLGTNSDTRALASFCRDHQVVAHVYKHTVGHRNLSVIFCWPDPASKLGQAVLKARTPT